MKYEGRTKKMWKMKVTVIPIVIGALRTIAKGLGKGTGKLRNQKTEGETIQTAALLRTVRIARRVLRRLAVTQSPVKYHKLTYV